ncbi:MAG: N-acetyltransferase [Gaiellaceae bacterium]
MIRLATDGDWPSILAVHRAAFDPEDVPRLVAELRDRSDLYVPELSFVAEDDGRVAGHVMNTWNWIEETDERVLQLSPLGVLPSYQRRGHGSELVLASLEAVRAAGEPLLLVEGAPAYYGRFGFVRADELGLLPPPEALYDWAFQVAVLDPEATLPQGRVVYSEPFRH